MIFKEKATRRRKPLFTTSKRYGQLVIRVFAYALVDADMVTELAYQEIRESNDPRKVAKKLSEVVSKEGIESTEVFVGGNSVWTIKLGQNIG